VPFLVEVFANKLPMTVFRCRFGAKEARAIQHLRTDLFLDSAFSHQCEESSPICAPIALLFLVGLQYLVGRRQQRFMCVVNVADLSEEIREIVGLGKTGELGSIVKAHVHDFLDTSVEQALEEILGGRPRESDGANHRAWLWCHFSDHAIRRCRA